MREELLACNIQVAKLLSSVYIADMPSILNDLFTPKEIVELGRRIEILKKLKDGEMQRNVAENMGISVTTVNRGSRVLKFGTGVLEKYIEKLK